MKPRKKNSVEPPLTVETETTFTESGASTAVVPMPTIEPRYRHGRCHRACRWLCDLTTPSCKCFLCIFCMMSVIIILMSLVIKYLQWRLKWGGSIWNALFGTAVNKVG